MHYSSTGGSFGTFTITFGPPIQPTCNTCPAQPSRQTPDGRLWCDRCLCIESAPEVLSLLFGATAKDARAKLYRALSAVYHPDQGGDERLMVALNVVYGRYK